MNSQNFTIWLQGYLAACKGPLTMEQTTEIAKMLETVSKPSSLPPTYPVYRTDRSITPIQPYTTYTT